MIKKTERGGSNGLIGHVRIQTHFMIKENIHMKKLLSLCLAALLLVSMLPVNVFASETSKHDELVALACDIFPEYANTILNKELITNSRSVLDRELVFTETRNISENEYLMYSEYSDNLSLLTYYNFEVELYDDGYVNGSAGRTLTFDIVATCAESGFLGDFTLNNVKFTLISSAYDQINSIGVPDPNGGCSIRDFDDNSIIENPDIQYTETSSSKAYIRYHLNFWNQAENSRTLNSVLELYVGNNNYSVSHLDYNEWL